MTPDYSHVSRVIVGCRAQAIPDMTSNSWVLITGGNRGLGFLTAKKLVTEGQSVIIGARTQASGAPPPCKAHAGGHAQSCVRFAVS